MRALMCLMAKIKQTNPLRPRTMSTCLRMFRLPPRKVRSAAVFSCVHLLTSHAGSDPLSPQWHPDPSPAAEEIPEGRHSLYGALPRLTPEEFNALVEFYSQPDGLPDPDPDARDAHDASQ